MASNFDEAKGRAKRAAGELTDDEKLKREGTVDKAAGKAKETVDSRRQGEAPHQGRPMSTPPPEPQPPGTPPDPNPPPTPTPPDPDPGRPSPDM